MNEWMDEWKINGPLPEAHVLGPLPEAHVPGPLPEAHVPGPLPEAHVLGSTRDSWSSRWKRDCWWKYTFKPVRGQSTFCVASKRIKSSNKLQFVEKMQCYNVAPVSCGSQIEIRESGSNWNSLMYCGGGAKRVSKKKGYEEFYPLYWKNSNRSLFSQKRCSDTLPEFKQRNYVTT